MGEGIDRLQNEAQPFVNRNSVDERMIETTRVRVCGIIVPRLGFVK